MPFHPDDGSPFFQLARTVIQQANFAVGIHIIQPDRILSHYDRLQHLLQIFVQLSTSLTLGDTIETWIQTILQLQRLIVQQLEEAEEYGYDLGDEDAAIIYPVLESRFHGIQLQHIGHRTIPGRKSLQSWISAPERFCVIELGTIIKTPIHTLQFPTTT
jgi:hypothetical protein